MTILEIAGQKVEVDESFLKLSPEDQQKTVNEIAAQLGIAETQEKEPSAAEQAQPYLDAAKTAGRLANPIMGAAQMLGDQIGQSALAEAPSVETTDLGPSRLAADRVPQELLDAQIAAGRQANYDSQPFYKKPLIAADDIIRNFANGQTFGFADKAAALANSIVGDKSYADQLKIEREKTQASKDRGGAASDVAEIAGNVRTGLSLGNQGSNPSREDKRARRGPTAARAVTSAAEGAGYGVLDALGNDTSVIEGAKTGAIAGTVGSLASDAASKVYSKASKMLSSDPDIPSLKKLKEAQRLTYEDAKNQGVILQARVLGDIHNQVKDDLTDMAYTPDLMPRTTFALKHLDGLLGEPITLNGLESARKVFKRAASAGDAEDRKGAMILVNALDSRIAKLHESDLIDGTPLGVQMMKRARELTVKVKKTEKIQEAMSKATRHAAKTGTGGNIENSIRQKVDGILNEKRKQGWTPDEKAAMDEIVNGSIGQNAMRLFGRLSPKGNGLMLWGTIVGSMHSPMIAAPAIAGVASKSAADANIKKAMKELELLVRSGGSKQALNSLRSTVSKMSTLARRKLSQAVMFSVIDGEHPDAANQ